MDARFGSVEWTEPAISRILFPPIIAVQRATIIHLGTPVARRLMRPTRELGRATLERSPIRSCTGWGLPSFPGHPRNWCALTAPFHPYPGRAVGPLGAVSFLLHLPSRCHDSTLWSTLPCGVRTFLRTFPSGDRLPDSVHSKLTRQRTPVFWRAETYSSDFSQ